VPELKQAAHVLGVTEYPNLLKAKLVKEIIAEISPVGTKQHTSLRDELSSNTNAGKPLQHNIYRENFGSLDVFDRMF
jgi:hypothetical protein